MFDLAQLSSERQHTYVSQHRTCLRIHTQARKRTLRGMNDFACSGHIRRMAMPVALTHVAWGSPVDTCKPPENARCCTLCLANAPQHRHNCSVATVQVQLPRPPPTFTRAFAGPLIPRKPPPCRSHSPAARPPPAVREARQPNKQHAGAPWRPSRVTGLLQCFVTCGGVGYPGRTHTHVQTSALRIRRCLTGVSNV